MKEITFDELRAKVRKEIDLRYGNLANFLNSKDAKKFEIPHAGYLWAQGSKNFKVISELASYFGIGTVSRKFVVVRECHYYIEECKPESAKEE